MKKILLLLVSLAFIISASGCGAGSELDPDKPVTLTLWHVYGEQADSPMNRLVDEFNSTVGKDKGIIINTTLISNTSQIGQKLSDSQEQKPGALDMPDLFFCHSSNVRELGVENVINWYEYFTAGEIENYIPDFVNDGVVDDSLAVFPVSKSTHLLFLNGTEFKRFSRDTGADFDDLATWEGFFDTAARFYEWSGGKAFCAFDYLLREAELNAVSAGAEPDSFYNGSWYDYDNKAFKKSWLQFADSLVKGHIVVSDQYSNTQVMTGDVAGGVGSSAGILYYNDTVTYPDNATEPVNLQILPLPKAEGGSAVTTQAGVGLCALKTTSQKAEASSVFAHWLTESERNLDFAAETGYMPVTVEAYDKTDSYEFKNEAYARLYKTLSEVKDSCTMVREPAMGGYYNKVYALYDSLRQSQDSFAKEFSAGASADRLALKTWKMLENIR